MTTLIALIILSGIIELVFSPRLDFTRDKKLLLWYGIDDRKYIVLF